MEFRTEIKWKNGTQPALAKLQDYLQSFEVDKDRALSEFYPGINKNIDSRVFFAVKCGDSSLRSLFLFHRGTENSSEISGKCLRDYVGDLKHDWAFLKEKIDETNLKYTAIHTRIELGNEILEKKTFKKYLKKREILAFLISSTSAPAAATGLIIMGVSETVLLSFLMGVLFWFLASSLGYFWEDEYALK